MEHFTCEICHKKIKYMKQYNEETVDVYNGFEVVVEHKQKYCKKKGE